METYYAHFFRFIILCWVTIRISLHALVLKKHILILSTAAALYSPLVWKQFLAPVSLRPLLLDTQSPLIGQLTYAWASTANNSAAQLNQFLCAKLAARHLLCKCVTLWRVVVTESWSQRRHCWWGIQGQCFLWERAASASGLWPFLVFLICTRTYKSHWWIQYKEHNSSPLNYIF